MPISIACTSCGAKFRIPDYSFGRIFKCPKCGKPVTVDAAPNQPTMVETVEPISPFRPVEQSDVPAPLDPDVSDVDSLGFFMGLKKKKLKKEATERELETFYEKRLDALAYKLEQARDADPHDCSDSFGASLHKSEQAREADPHGMKATACPAKADRHPFEACLGYSCLMVLGVILLTICSWLFSSDHGGTNITAEMIEKAHQRGAEVGREEGRRAGEAEGFAASFDSAEQEAYRETIDELYQSLQFQRIPLYTVGVVFGFFILGFMIQWIVLYVPRRAGYLRDIDWIVLPKEMTQVDLDDLSFPPAMEPTRLKPPSAGTTLICLLTLLSMIGCKNREEDAWQKGYDANRNAAYQEGWREGTPRGEKEGKERGKAEAEHAAQTGREWHLYKTPAFLALMFGIIVGLAVQYTVLACCNDAGRVSEMATVALVPAMKHSLAYSILESRRKLLIWWEQEKNRLAAANQFKAAQIQAVHDVIVRKLKVMTALEELTQTRLLDLARQELSKVVSDAEQKARMITKRAVACPHCGRNIAYPRKKAGKTVNCPYTNCGRPINLPTNTD